MPKFLVPDTEQNISANSNTTYFAWDFLSHCACCDNGYTVTDCLCIQLQSKLQSQKNADRQL